MTTLNEALDGTYADWLQYNDERYATAMDSLIKEWKREDLIINLIFGFMFVVIGGLVVYAVLIM